MSQKVTGREAEIRNLRIAKIERLKEVGMEAYPDPKTTRPSVDLKDVVGNFSAWEKEQKEYVVAGRIMVKRGAGKISFAKIFDGTAEFQVVLQADVLGVEKMKIFEKLFDMGDFANFTGTLFVTQKGEDSLKVTDFKMAGKSLLPMPEKWHGLQDVEEKYRRRYLDTLSDKESFERFKIRADVIKIMREILDEEGMIEIETPILQNQASGAMAETFNTYHNDYGMDMVLRIAVEAEHKQIMVGGYAGVYEFGKDFRNEGSDSTHHQEFTMLEFYKAFRGLEWNMDLTEKMLRKTLELVNKDVLEITNKDGSKTSVDFSGKWERKKFMDLISEYAGIDPIKASREELEQKAVSLGETKENVEKLSQGNLLDFIYKKTARKNIINPTFVMNYPADMKPLAIQNEDGTAEMTQLVIAGAEITNQYAELVDPIVQRKLLEDQAQAKAGGDAEAMDMNESFIEAMEHGMPPMTGNGIGIDRWVAVLTEQSNIRDTILFPIMKPEKKPLSKKAAEKKYREKKIVIIANEDMGHGVTANAIGQLGIEIGMFSQEKLAETKHLYDADDRKHYVDAFYGMSNLSGSPEILKEFVLKCHEQNVQVFDFSDIMRRAHSDEDMIKGYKEKKTSDIEYIAVGAVVEKDFEKEFLSQLELFGKK